MNTQGNKTHIVSVKKLAARGALFGGMGLAALGFGTGLAHADTELPPSMSTPGKTEAPAVDPGEAIQSNHPIPHQKGLSTAAPDSPAIPTHLEPGFKPEPKDHDSQ
jgi:hypothetical protein